MSHTAACELEGPHDDDEHVRQHEDGHGHSHGLVDRSILRSRAGIRAVSLSLAILTVTALAQAFIYYRTLSVALLADLIHNFGDALTAIPLGIAFYLRSARGERWGGLGVVLAIFISALVALGVIASAAVVALGLQIADPMIGLIITLVILRITWDSWHTVRSTEIEIDHFEHRD